jgi:hypothetical protein
MGLALFFILQVNGNCEHPHNERFFQAWGIILGLDAKKMFYFESLT